MALDDRSYDSWRAARRICVIGAGTMGSGIAAHLANIGFEVTLLDVTREAADAGLAKARQLRPPHFYVQDRAVDIRTGGIADALPLLSEMDWVCEAIVERLDAKRALFAQIEPFIRPDAMITTNTSGLQIEMLAEGMPSAFRSRFMGTHFFNPPRYLKLLELIPTGQTDPSAVAAMTSFLEERVARRVVVAKDTPGFIANRFGMWSMFHAIHTAERLHLPIETVDAITGPFIGRPRSASFRLNDLVGLDIMQDIAANLIERCPHDPHRAALATPASMRVLLERGWIGEKVGQGYYRKEGRELLALDLQTFAYRQRLEPQIPSIASLGGLPVGERIAQALTLRDEAGEFLRNHLVPVLRYADFLKQEISHSVRDIDRVMMWGFGWELGPFALIDAIGANQLGIVGKTFYMNGEVLGFDGSYRTPAAEPQYATLADFPVVDSTETLNLRDLGDGVMAVCSRSKMGVISTQLVAELTAWLESGKLDRFVLTSEARSFSAGFDLNFFLGAIESGQLELINDELKKLQHLGALLSQTRSVAAVYGHCLGAGLELAISCPHIAASAETTIGLPEAKVGLIPGGRGTVLMRMLNAHSAKRLAEVAVSMAAGSVSASADHARLLGYLRPTDVTVYHPDTLLMRAKDLVLNAEIVTPTAWTTPEGPVSGMIDRSLDEMRSRGELTEYDTVIGDKIRLVFAKSGSYENALELERTEFLDLCGRALTHARIRHMLESGKPLRN